MVIGIIGAGASGMMAAISAGKNDDNQILLFERQARVGRKLQATGNGRCNLTNLNCHRENYHGNDGEFFQRALEVMPPCETLSFFRSLGLYTVAEDSGRVYPYSDQANSVVDVLRFALQKDNIELLTGVEIKRIRKNDNGFTVEADEGAWHCDRLIVACGGLAGTKLGGSMNGYRLLRSFGHSVTKLRPALVQLKSLWRGCIALKGVRANCDAEVRHNGVLVAKSAGELQFTEYGLSGPVVFEISRDVCQGGGEWTCRLDFLPKLSCEELYELLSAKRQTELTAEDLFTGVIHNRLGRVIVAETGISLNSRISRISDEQLMELCRVVKDFEVILSDTMGMDSAQVTAGGIATGEFDSATMESRIVPGLYACGEVLDVDGDCGGYNLQWAWSSGYLAGCSAGEVPV